MKNRIKKHLPKSILIFYQKLRDGKYLFELYNFDKKRFKKSSYDMSKGNTQKNLRSRITFQYHSIEKGLSNVNFRPGFGKRAFTGLFDAMDKYLELDYPIEDSRFQQGISTIEDYVKTHNKLNYKVEDISNKLQDYKEHSINGYSNTGGAKELTRKNLPNYNSSNFRELAMNRHSIRDFGEESINEEDIMEAIRISIKTPSVCNRQAFRAYYIKDEKKLNEAFLLQGGLVTHGVNLQGLILVTVDRQYMNGPHERNQTYIDGGLFNMSLVYALTYKNIATCILNTDFNLKKEKEMRELLSIPYSEDLIAFTALGSFPKKIKIAKSTRDQLEEITTII